MSYIEITKAEYNDIKRNNIAMFDEAKTADAKNSADVLRVYKDAFKLSYMDFIKYIDFFVSLIVSEDDYIYAYDYINDKYYRCDQLDEVFSLLISIKNNGEI